MTFMRGGGDFNFKLCASDFLLHLQCKPHGTTFFPEIWSPWPLRPPGSAQIKGAKKKHRGLETPLGPLDPPEGTICQEVWGQSPAWVAWIRPMKQFFWRFVVLVPSPPPGAAPVPSPRHDKSQPRVSLAKATPSSHPL